MFGDGYNFVCDVLRIQSKNFQPVIHIYVGSILSGRLGLIWS